jgi:hypothetical protein
MEDLVLGLIVHVTPPSELDAVTIPRDPPLLQRSCCQAPSSLRPSAGFTETQGSISLFTKLVPDPG